MNTKRYSCSPLSRLLRCQIPGISSQETWTAPLSSDSGPPTQSLRSWQHPGRCPGGFGVTSFRLVWCVVSFRVVFLFGLVWCGLVWFRLVWFSLVWFGLIWFGLVWFDLVWFGLVWFGLVWFGLFWCGGLCFFLLRCQNTWEGPSSHSGPPAQSRRSKKCSICCPAVFLSFRVV